jgi:hypothetical protein
MEQRARREGRREGENPSSRGADDHGEAAGGQGESRGAGVLPGSSAMAPLLGVGQGNCSLLARDQRRWKMGRWWSAAGGRRRGAGGTAPLLAEGRKGAAAGRQPEVEEGLGSHGRKRVPAR